MTLQFKKMKNKISFFLLSLMFLSSACTDDFEDLNRNPFSPTQTDIGPLFNNVVSTLKLGWNEQFYLYNEKLYGITQLAAKTATGFDNVSIGTEELWTNYYTALAHIKEIERRLEALASEMDPSLLEHAQAQLNVIKAYKTFKLTDLFGDIPFSEAGLGFEGNESLRPIYDTQESIYKSLLNDLGEADLIFENTFPEGAISFSGYDKLFFENLLTWRKFANSLRLKHTLRMYEADPDFANPIIADILNNQLPLLEKGENVVMDPDLQSWRNEGLNWSFREHKKLRMGTNIWNQMAENLEDDGSGIYDVRAELFFETNNENKWVPFPQNPSANTVQSGGIPYQQHRDQNYPIKGADNIYSPFNYYLVRDEIGIPEIIMTAAEIGFVKAEIYLRGIGVSEDEAQAQSAYTLAVVESVDFWKGIEQGSAIWLNGPTLLANQNSFAVANHPFNFINDSNNKLALIYKQRFIDAFRQPWEAYALMRRTNGATPHEGVLENHNRFSYPPSEAINNPDNWAAQVAKMGEDSESIKVWWNN